MLDERPTERTGIGQGIAQERRVVHRCPIVTEAHGAGVRQLPERRQAFAGSPLGDRAVDQHPDRRRRSVRETQHVAQARGPVERRVRVGHRAHRREATVGGCGETGRDRLGVLVAGLAQMHVEVDETGQHEQVRLTDRRAAARPGQLADAAALDEQAAPPLTPGAGIDQPGILDLEPRTGPADARTHGSPPASSSRMAMRTATPLATCAVTSEAGPAATSDAISTPSLRGPGWSTTASGRASARRAAVRP